MIGLKYIIPRIRARLKFGYIDLSELLNYDYSTEEALEDCQ